MTLPSYCFPPRASTVTTACWPSLSRGKSASSTWTSVMISLRSETVRMTVPAKFMVPMTAVSPTLAFTAVTTPSMGERMVVLAR